MGLTQYQMISEGGCGTAAAENIQRIGRVAFTGLMGLAGAASGALIGFISWEIAAGTIPPSALAELQLGIWK